ncbi:MAG: MCE family protein [Nocardia sp.]|nr:MCE family protein [Nocardia sp.]
MTERLLSHRCRRTLPALLSAAAILGVAGCGPTVDNLPMPKPGVSGPTYTIHAVFGDALNLPDHAHVRIGGTDVGTVTQIETTNFQADVGMSIRSDISLPRGTTAELRQATPLGDMFVAMTLPSQADSGPALRNGDTIGADHTATAASVEQLMMSVSLLLNGGAINQAAKIASEMDSMFDGRGPQFAHLIGEMTSVITALDQRTADIDSALNGMNALTGELARHKAELGTVADTFPKLLGVISENNQRIVDLTGKVSTAMSAIGDFTNTTGPQAKSLFDSIQRLMSGFTESGNNLAGTLDAFHQLYPPVMAGTRGPALTVMATVSALSLSALSDPNSGRWPNGGDIPLFIGSLTQVFQKVFGRVTSPPHALPGYPPPPAPPAPGGPR